MLGAWAARIDAGIDARAPEALRALAREPPEDRASALPFAYARVQVPSTPPVTEPTYEPVWPPGVPMPAAAIDTYADPAAINNQLARVARWSAAQIKGDDAPRPAAKAWSDQARLPWCRGRVFDFASRAAPFVAEERGDRGGDEWYAAVRGPAVPPGLSAPAVLWYFRDVTHRQLVSMCIHG
eukprot:5165242-Pleurochrysis_carterae.AAC.1